MRQGEGLSESIRGSTTAHSAIAFVRPEQCNRLDSDSGTFCASVSEDLAFGLGVRSLSSIPHPRTPSDSLTPHARIRSAVLMRSINARARQLHAPKSLFCRELNCSVWQRTCPHYGVLMMGLRCTGVLLVEVMLTLSASLAPPGGESMRKKTPEFVARRKEMG